MQNALILYDGQCLRVNALTASSTALQPIFQTAELRSVSRRSLGSSKKLYSTAVSVSLENEYSCGSTQNSRRINWILLANMVFKKE